MRTQSSRRPPAGGGSKGGWQFVHLGSARAPKVDTGAEAYREYVERRPVDKVEVEVVLEGGCIEDLWWRERVW